MMVALNLIGGNGDEGGSNSYNVFKKIFGNGDYQYENAGDFDALVQGLISGRYAKIVVPVSNNISGEVTPAREALNKYVTSDVQLVEEGEHERLINHALIGGPSSSLETLAKIYGYPVATAQCRRVLDALHKEEIFHPDTYGAVADVVKRNNPDEGAVGPFEAAEKEGGKVLMANLSDDLGNTTTFKIYSLE